MIFKSTGHWLIIASVMLIGQVEIWLQSKWLDILCTTFIGLVVGGSWYEKLLDLGFMLKYILVIMLRIVELNDVDSITTVSSSINTSGMLSWLVKTKTRCESIRYIIDGMRLAVKSRIHFSSRLGLVNLIYLHSNWYFLHDSNQVHFNSQWVIQVTTNLYIRCEFQWNLHCFELPRFLTLEAKGIRFESQSER